MAALIKFGVFDFDPDTRELRREGVPMRLQSQPAQVLGLLLSRAGEVVTRETLRQAIWGAGTFVDFDRGLNFCIAQIRSALGDSADSPRFIRTLPKRGYQFIAPVVPAAAAETKELPPVAQATPPSARRISRLWPALLALFIVAAAILWWRPWSAVRPQIRVAVARFDNETGDPDLDRFADGLTDSLVADLTASAGGRYGVIGNAAILRLPRRQRDLRAIGASLGAGYVILGQVQKTPGHLRVLAHLIHLPEQTHLDVMRFDSTADDPLRVEADLAHQIAVRFARHLGSSHPAATD